jgi:hypothetical protein
MEKRKGTAKIKTAPRSKQGKRPILSFGKTVQEGII